jgi:hypothetical protein
MRSISELFEFLSNCDKETIITELYDLRDHIIQKNGTKSERFFELDIENLNTLFRLSEWYLEKELPRMIEEKNPKKEGDEIMTIEVPVICFGNIIILGIASGYFPIFTA